MRYVQLLGLIAVLFVACKKDSNPAEVVTTVTTAMPVKVNYYTEDTTMNNTPDIIYNLSYNDQKQLAGAVMHITGKSDSLRFEFNYNADGTIASLKNKSIAAGYLFRYDFELYYNGGTRLDSLQVIDYSGYSGKYNVFTYNTEEKLTNLDVYVLFNSERIRLATSAFEAAGTLLHLSRPSYAESNMNISGQYFITYGNMKDTAALSPSLLFLFAQTWSASLSDINNLFLYQFLDPKTPWISTNLVNTAMPEGYISSISYNANSTVNTLKYKHSTSSGISLRAGLKFEY